MRNRSSQFLNFQSALLLVALIAFIPRSAVAQQPASAQSPTTLRAAVCPIVYPNDETPGAKGFRYTFFGNAFFINSQGYLVTAAHVLQTFRDLGQPYILVDRPNAPPQKPGTDVERCSRFHPRRLSPAHVCRFLESRLHV